MGDAFAHSGLLGVIFLALWLHSGLSPFQYTSRVRNGYLHLARNQIIFSDLFGVRLRVWAGTENWSQKERAMKHSLLSSFFMSKFASK